MREKSCSLKESYLHCFSFIFLVAHTAFYKDQTIIEFIKETEGLQDRDFQRPLQHYLTKRIEKSLKGLKVI